MFSGGFDIEAVEALAVEHASNQAAICQTLAALVDKSLVQRSEQFGTTRFTMLETIRAFALDQLAKRARSVATYRQRAQFFLALAQCVDTYSQIE